MKNIKKNLSENFHFLVVKFSVYLNRRGFVMQNRYICKQCRSRWDGSRAMSSRSTLFAILFLIFDCHPFCNSGHVQIQGWKSPLQTIRSEKMNIFVRGSCKKFCHWFPISSVLRFIKYFYYKPSKYPPLLKHIFVTFARPSYLMNSKCILVVSKYILDCVAVRYVWCWGRGESVEGGGSNKTLC